MTNRIQLPLTVRVLAAKQAAAFLEDISGMNAVVVATEDGFDIASAMKTGDAARIAALASSISAISAVVSQEASLGADKCVIIDTHDGFAVVYSAPRKDARLVIIAIASGQAILGQVAYRASQFAKDLADA